VLDSLLRFGFFHGAFGFGGTLGAGFGSLLALFVENFFAAEEFDEGVVGSITFAESSTNDAEVATVAIAKAGTDGVEQFVDSGTGHELRESVTAGGEISALAQRDHLFDLWAHGFRFGHRGLDSFFENERSDQIPQE